MSIEGIDLDAIASDMKDQTPIDRKIKDAIKAGDELTINPTADLFPLMVDEDPDGWAQFKEDVANQGEVFESIKIDNNGTILDGRNRIRAITELAAEGVDIRFDVEIIKPVDDNDWIISTNLHRRHLTDSQRAYLAAELAQDPNVQLKDAAEKLGVPVRSAKRANVVVKQADDKTKADVKSGKKKVATAVRETTGKKQGSKTKGEYQQEAKPKDKPPGKVTNPPTTVTKETKGPRAKAATGLSDAGYQELRLQLRDCSLEQLNELTSLVRGLVRERKSQS